VFHVSQISTLIKYIKDDILSSDSEALVCVRQRHIGRHLFASTFRSVSNVIKRSNFRDRSLLEMQSVSLNLQEVKSVLEWIAMTSLIRDERVYIFEHVYTMYVTQARDA